MSKSIMHANDDLSGSVSEGSFKKTALQALKPFASLQVTVTLFVIALFLVFFGTLAQMNEGIWTVVDKYFRSSFVWVPLQLFAQFLQIFFDLNPDIHWSGSFPFPGGWLIGSLLLTNLLAAHLVRFRLTWKRSGILVIHSGMVLLMVAEIVTGLRAVESTMTLAQGESSNFTSQSLAVELAISRPLENGVDEVVKIPQSRLQTPGIIAHADLPVDVEVLEYWRNSDPEIREGPPPDESWTSFAGGRGCFRMHQRAEGAGVDQDQRGDAPAIRVNLLKKGTNESVGHFTLSLWYYLNERNVALPPFKFTVDGREYTIELRGKRLYLPYTIRLKNLEHSNYEGTTIAKNYASTVDVIDPDEGGDREVRIWMNNPLRYKGLSFYQLSVLGNDSGTVLQVVRNPGRLLPYLACAMISLGMVLHFGLHLNMFLKRKKLREAAVRKDDGYLRFIPLAVVVIAGAWIASKAWVPSTPPGQIDYYDAGQIPVRQGGRLKPIDTVARTTLQAISTRSEVQDEDKKVVASAMQWFIDVFDSGPLNAKAADYKVFRVDNEDLRTFLQLKPRPEFLRYSLNEIMPRYQAFEAEYQKVQQKGGKKLDKRDSKILDLGKKLHLYQQLAEGKTPDLVPPQSDGEEWRTMDSVDKFSKQEIDAIIMEAEENVRQKLAQEGINLDDLAPAARSARIKRAAQEILADEIPAHREQVSPAAAKFGQLIDLAKDKKTEEFKKALASYRSEYLGRLDADQMWDMKFETFFNHFDPFYLCSMLYVMVIILACLSWLGWREPLNQAAFWLCVLTVLLHTFALMARMYLQGRPPVTNLYSSAVFIGWAGVFLCLGLERYYRNGIGNVLAGAVGALTMMMAHFLSEGGDTMEMLVAVLDTNFWLATHVTMVTLGYMATFVAGGIGLKYILRGIFTTSIAPEDNKVFGQMIYGVICFATLLSFTGTVLGGLWADYSWGRFWGWDAKENGAVMVVIWNTLILHARWAGLVKLRGVAVLTLVGNMITFWSWYGTNQLGAGLHNYGFNTELAERCRYFWLVNIAFIGIGLLPLRYWRSFSPETLQKHAAQAKRDAQQRKESERRGKTWDKTRS